MPTLYGAPLSPFVRKVAIALEEKKIPYEWVMLAPHTDHPEFKKLSPLGKIPAYKDDRVGLADSSVICFYLEKTHPTPPLYPEECVELARALWLEEYIDGAVYQPMSTIYFQQMFNPRFKGRPTDHALLQKAIDVELPPMLAYLESQIRPGTWLAGTHFSIADIAVSMGFANLRLAGYTIDAKKYPNLTAHAARMEDRPSFRKVGSAMQEFFSNLKPKA